MLSQLTLTHYRNFNSLYLAELTPVTVITGPNGVGKTNILESIALLHGLPIRRVRRANEVIQWNESEAFIEATFENLPYATIRVLIQSRRLRYVLDSQEQPAHKIHQLIPIMIFAPDNVLLFNADPAPRREFLDAILISILPEYNEARTQYQRVLKQRNAALKQGQYRQLGLWEEQLAESAATITISRNWLLRELSREFSLSGHLTYIPSPRSITEKEGPTLPAKGNVRENLQESAGNVREFLREKWERLREREIQVGFTLMGPQRDDFRAEVEFEHLETRTQKDERNLIDVGQYASRGQQRLTVLHLQLAALQLLREQGEIAPIWLLDDVFSELDEQNQHRIVEACQHFQAFITTTNTGYSGIQMLLQNSTTSLISLPSV